MSAKLSDYVVRACAWVQEVRYVNLLPLPHTFVSFKMKRKNADWFSWICAVLVIWTHCSY